MLFMAFWVLLLLLGSGIQVVESRPLEPESHRMHARRQHVVQVRIVRHTGSDTGIASTRTCSVSGTLTQTPIGLARTIQVGFTLPTTAPDALTTSLISSTTPSSTIAVASATASPSAPSSDPASISSTSAAGNTSPRTTTSSSRAELRSTSISLAPDSLPTSSSPSFSTSQGSGSGSGSDSDANNLQKFAGSLGGISAPAVSSSGTSQFSVDGANSQFNSAADALRRSCGIQHNLCADAANDTRNQGSLTVAACDTQEKDCFATIS
ncbi:hypothetical protein MKEN_00364200 [Mycena kentingensis (nom. inval.)]|nr:hypothetical protein MKEN_00364200 [Mycena kentingensis (nom. inval.)]